MRGKGYTTAAESEENRITPAYAGKSPLSDHIQNKAWDHPRLCGEKLSDAVSSLLTLGSPPPMRGKGRFCMMQSTQCGITPAYAGKSFRIVTKKQHA